MVEFCRFLALTLRMGHDQKDSVRDYWAMDERQTTPFFPETMVRDLFCIYYGIYILQAMKIRAIKIL
jgi:hypothetical protein